MAATRTRQKPEAAPANACPWLDPGAQGERLNVEDFPTFLLWRLANVAKSSVTKKYLEHFELSLPEWRLLALINRFAPMAFSELSARSSMDKGQVSRTLQAISARGLVHVESAPAATRRLRSSNAPIRIEVSMTSKGRALYRRIVPVARHHQLKFLRLMSEKERLMFYNVSRRLLTALPELSSSD